MSRRYINADLLHRRSDQIIQVDVDTGNRLGVRRTVVDVQKRPGMILGTVSIDYEDYLVRQIGNTTEWYFCDQAGNRIKREFQIYNEQYRLNGIKRAEKMKRWKHVEKNDGKDIA